MNSKNLILALSITAALAPACVAVDTEDEVQQGVELTHSPRTISQQLTKLTELNPQGLQLQGNIRPLGPAQGVTYFQIYAVESSNSGANWEFVGASQFSTTIDHGGAQLSVAVLQFGYGNGGASLGGLSGVNWATDTLCGSLSTLHFCSVGEIVTGFIDYYSFDGQQGGSCFSFTNSIASPFGQSTDSITIL
jgi:hypothetical protein